MDKNNDFNFYGVPQFNGNSMYDMNFEQPQNPNNINSNYNNFECNPMLNPFAQYEQAYMYYRYLAMQMEYKIKCKEYENLSAKVSSRDGNRKIE